MMNGSVANPIDRAQDVRPQHSDQDSHPEISRPTEFEHFLHVGATNLSEVTEICKDQQATFAQVVERRARQLPELPSTPFSDTQRTNRSTPRINSTTGSARNTPRRADRSGSTKMLRSFLRGDTPKKRGQEEQTKKIEEALYAVENDQTAELNQLVSAEQVDVNCRDGDGHTLLDLAVMLNHTAMVRLLQLYGGIETDKYVDPNARKVRLEVILRAKQIALSNLMEEIEGGRVDLYAEHERNSRICERAELIYRKWNTEFRKAGVPAAPSSVKIRVSSPTGVTLSLGPVRDHGKAIVTRFRVEWAHTSDFRDSTKQFVSSMVKQFTLEGLPKGQPCYFRVASLNMKGRGPAVKSQPPFVIPSSWHELADTPDRLATLQDQVASVAANMDPSVADQAPHTKKALKFGQALKSAKSVKRGLYLACLVYDPTDPSRILAVGGQPPIIPAGPALSPQDMAHVTQFVQQLSVDWSLARDMVELSEEVSTLQARRKIAEAVCCLQHLLGVTDIGSLYHVPIQEANGATIFVSVTAMTAADASHVSLSWTSFSDARPSAAASPDGAGPARELLASAGTIVSYGTGCGEHIEPGLYLAALIPQSTIGGLAVTVPTARAHTLPSIKIRESSNVSKDEWQFIRHIKTGGDKARQGTSTHGSDLALRIYEHGPALLTAYGLDPSQAGNWRLYAEEVVSLNADACMLILVPPAEQFLTETRHHAESSVDSQLLLSLSWFEMLAWQQLDLSTARLYSKLWIKANNDAVELQYKGRSAMGSEAASFKHKAKQAQDNADQLAASWKDAQYLSLTVMHCRKPDDASVFPLEIIKRSVRAMPSTPASAAAAAVASEETGMISRLTLDVLGQGKVLVFAENRQGELSQHRVQIAATASAADVVKALQTPLGVIGSGEEYCLCLVQPNGNQRRLPDDCRPVLLQHYWTSKRFKVLFRKAS